MKLLTTLFLITLISFSVRAQQVFEIKFTAGVTQYRCALVIFDNGSGKMRVRFYGDGKTKMVEQAMRIEDTQYGLRLTGYNPVYPGTSTRYPSYNADNFYISMDEYGNYSVTNVDDAGVSARSSIRKVEGQYTINGFLDDFNWELN